jgi:CubicO group peptidase (beta-lactamase class C family)
MKTARRLAVLACVSLLAVLGAGAPPSHLEKLRLLPAVLIKGETGWSIDERMKRYKVEAVSVAVFKDYQVLWTEARGLADRENGIPATTETLFQAGSISKPVAAAAILKRVEKGDLALDRNVNDYLKSWKLPDNELTAKRKVSLELLLSHSAGTTVHGFPGYAVGEAIPTVPQILDGAAPANTAPVRVDLEPGTKFRYSGGGTTIAQLVQMDTTGRAFPDLLRELVLKPAGMTHSTYEQPLPPDKLKLAAADYRADGKLLPGQRHTYPEMAAAGLWTTSEDLTRFAIAIGHSLRGDKGALLSKEMASKMTTPYLKDAEAGLGLFANKRGSEVYVGHDGADEGFQAILTFNRDKGYGAAVMANSDRGINLAGEIVRGLAKDYGWDSYLPQPVTTVTLSPAELLPLVGRYKIGSNDTLSLSMRDGRLYGIRPYGEEYELFAVSRDQFIRKSHAVDYRVERSGNAVAAIETTYEGEKERLPHMPDGAKIPWDYLQQGDTAGARAAFMKIYAENPEDPAVSEEGLNQSGYNRAYGGEYPAAIFVMKLNTELRPTSTNTYDSLADVYLMAGDRASALDTYKRLLEVAPKDTKTKAELKARLVENAERKLRE